jgi:predicted TIM-barrel fold metal-dependent hydrolase
VQQLDYAINQLGLKGASIGGHVDGARLSDRKFDPFWAKVQDMGIVVSCIPTVRRMCFGRVCGTVPKAPSAIPSAIRWKRPSPCLI